MPTGATMLEAFGTNFPGLIRLLTAAAYLIGVWAGGSALLMGWRRNRDGTVTTGALLVRLLLCATCLYLPTAIATGQETLFGSPTLLTYSPGSLVSAQGRVILDTVLRFVQLVGLGFFLWGFLLLNRAHLGNYDPGLGTQAFAHIVGGVCCMNVIAGLRMLAESFGVEKLLGYLVVAG